MAYVAEADRYPYSPSEVLSGFNPPHRAIIKDAATSLIHPPKHTLARKADCPEAVVEAAVPYRENPTLHRLLLGAAGSYAKAKGWWAPKPQRGRMKDRG